MVERFFLRNSYDLLARSLKTPYGEVDRLFRSPEGEFLILEVKSSVNPWGSEAPLIHNSQRKRLYRSLEYLSTQMGGSVELMYAVVNKNEITLYGESFESL